MLARLIQLCVERRLAVLAIALGIAAYGVHAYLQTPIEAFPDVTNLQVNVITQMPGLAPPEIEQQITIPLERALNGTPQMMRMRSESLFGLSLIYLTFEDGADSFRCRTIVAERLARADLPDGVVAELGPDATPLGQVYQYHVESDRHTLTELRTEEEWFIAPYLKRTPGVADVVTRGGFLRELHVEVDSARLAAHDLTMDDVERALRNSNRNVGGGFLRRGDQQLVVRGVGVVVDEHEIAQSLVGLDDGVPITVGDVARVLVSHTPRQGSVGYQDQRDVVEGVVYLRRGQNPSVVLEQIHDRVDQLNHGLLPEGMRVVPFYDRSRLVNLTLDTVHENLLEGALLVVVLVLIFVRSWRGALIVGSVIPLALLVAFIGLYTIQLPANLISMGAIDFGILVDGAIILVESVIHRLREEKPETREQYFQLLTRAAASVSRPTLFAMAIIIAALIPVFTLQSVEGRIFRPLALTYSFALLGALLFSLTLVPALCALAMRNEGKSGHEPRYVTILGDGYARALAGLRKRWWAVVLGTLALVAIAGAVAPRLGTEFLPELDEGDLLVFVEMPSSIALEPGQDVLNEVRRRIMRFPEVVSVETQQGRPEDGTDNESVNMAEVPVRLRSRDEWRPGWDTERLVEAIRAELVQIPGIRFNFSQPIKDNVEEAMSGVRGKVVLKIFGTDLEQMRATLVQAIGVLSHIQGITDLSLYRDRSVPQLEIRTDRAALARVGLEVAEVQSLVETSMSGRVVTRVWRSERATPVRLRLARQERQDPTRLGDLLVPAANGSRIPLRELAQIRVAPGRASINREDNSRSLSLKFNVEGRDLGSVIAEAVDAVGRQVHPPEGHHFVWAGEFENQQRAMQRLAIVVPLSVLVVFVLLFMALGSARPAFSVLAIAPFAMSGGVFALWATGIHLSVSAAIGFIALLGQVSLAALLVVGAIEDRRKEGLSLEEAVKRGPADRFRAVLLTALLAMFGLLPMAISTGVGSETQKPFAVVLIGGVATTLIVVLFALPTVYRWIAARDKPA